MRIRIRTTDLDTGGPNTYGSGTLGSGIGSETVQNIKVSIWTRPKGFMTVNKNIVFSKGNFLRKTNCFLPYLKILSLPGLA